MFLYVHTGYFGTDCSLSEGPDGQEVILKGLGYTEAASGPKVYVYELPPEYHVKYVTARVHKHSRAATCTSSLCSCLGGTLSP